MVTADARTRRDTAPRSTSVESLPTLPAIVEGTITHTRRGAVQHAFSNRVYQWLVDLDELPRLPWWLRPGATFDSGDHLGDPELSIKNNVVAFCSERGVDLGGGRVLMLANARVLGHVFDPLSVFWCLRADGSLACILAEVHNTHGERHVYMLDPDEVGNARTDKRFYVSPFFTVDGTYDLRFTLSGERVVSSIVLRQGGKVVFNASFVGSPRPASNRTVLTTLLSHPLMPQRVSLLIRLHGVILWARRLPVIKRTPHVHQKGV